MGTDNFERAARRISQLADCGLDALAFFKEAQEHIVAAVPALLTNLDTLDPASLLITSSYDGEGSELPHETLVWEYCEDDVLKNVDLIKSGRGIETLHQATGGDPSSSVFYNQFLKPFGVEHAVLVDLRDRNHQSWGALCMVRAADQGDFDPKEQQFLLSVAPDLALGVRRGLLMGEATDPEEPQDPALLVLGADWEVESLSPGAGSWLADISGSWEREGKLPAPVLSVAAGALGTVRGNGAEGFDRVRIRGRSGRWMVLHGIPLPGSGANGKAAVIIEPARPARIASLLMDAYGLTLRERELTQLVLQGASTAEIAAALFISAHTVQQHLKSIFDKTGVRSRRELVSRVFFAHYEPRVRDNERRESASRPIRGGPFPLVPAPGRP